MLCLQGAKLPEGDAWVYEIKWDGYRAISSKSGRVCRLYSRNGNSFAADFPEVVAALGLLKCRSAVVDGEVVAWGPDGKPSFQLLQKRGVARNIILVVFDLLALNGRDLRNKPLTLRRAALTKILPKDPKAPILLSTELHGPPNNLLEQAKALGLEGIVAKRRDSVYESGERSGAWVKRRAELTGRFLVGGYVPGSHGFEELIIGERRGRELHFICRLKAGFVPATRLRVMAAIKPHAQATCPFVNLPEPSKARWGQGLDAEAMDKCRWLKPKVSICIAFVEWTEGRKLRHPKFVALD